MAHFGIGYTLCDLDRYREALPYLRHYARIASHGPWSWVWLGQMPVGSRAGSSRRGVLPAATALSEAGAEETDAPELLAELDAL